MTIPASRSSRKGSCTQRAANWACNPGTSQSSQCRGGRSKQRAPLAFLSVPQGLCLVHPDMRGFKCHLAKRCNGAFPIAGATNTGEKDPTQNLSLLRPDAGLCLLSLCPLNIHQKASLIRYRGSQGHAISCTKTSEGANVDPQKANGCFCFFATNLKT